MAERIEERDLLEASRGRILAGPWVESSPRRVRVYFNGVAVADSRAVLLAFEPKRLPVYWTMRDGPRDLLWGYPFPIPECPKIENLVSFFNEKVDISVDGELQPRPVTIWS